MATQMLKLGMAGKPQQADSARGSCIVTFLFSRSRFDSLHTTVSPFPHQRSKLFVAYPELVMTHFTVTEPVE